MGYIDVAYQTATFLLSLGLGAFCCLIYDLVRVLHKTCVKKFIPVMIVDLAYWLVVALITYCFLLMRCLGYVRAFVLLGELCGFAAFRLTLSPIILFLWEKTFLVISATLRLFMTPWKFIVKKVRKISRKCEKFLKKVVNSIKNLLKRTMRMLYNWISNIKSEKKAKATGRVKT